MSNLTHLIERAVQVSASKVATVCRDRTRTYAEVAERVARFGGALQYLGCQQGARIAILSLNSDRYFECYFSVPWAACEIVPLNTRWSLAETLYALDDSETEVLVFDDAHSGQAEEIISRSKKIRHVIYLGDAGTPAWAKNYETLITDTAPVKNANVSPDSLYGIFYTGGTTGFPKGVMLSHRAIWSSSVCAALEFDVAESCTYLHVAPMFHLADFAMLVTTTIRTGRHVISSLFDPAQMPKIIAGNGVTHVLLVPAMLKMFLDNPAIDESDLSGLKRIIYGAAPITASILEKALRKLPDCGFVQAYGQTELAPLATILGSEHHVVGNPKLRSAGRPTFCTRVKIVDTEGHEVPLGQVGEVIVSGPNTMLGYWRKPELTAANLKDGWVYTGDAASMDEDGFVYIADRIKDVIITGGENVYSAEVENAISSHELVADVAVIGIPSEQWGESVHAVVIPKNEAVITADEIILHCKSLIASYKCPKSVEFRSGPFPLSGANKVLKTELRKPYWEGHDRRVN